MKKNSTHPGLDRKELLETLKKRFEKNMDRHRGLKWDPIEIRLMSSPAKMGSLQQMEDSGGEPDVIKFDKRTDEYIFCDFSPESPKNRRSVCYDQEALDCRKQHKPHHSALGMATEMGIEIMSEEQYRELQELGTFDTKTSSWLITPDEVRTLGGAIFGDRRYGRTFIYHNGAESYYAARGFRGILKV